MGQLRQLQQGEAVGIPLAGLTPVHHHHAVVPRLIVAQHAPGVFVVHPHVGGGDVGAGLPRLVQQRRTEGPTLPGPGGQEGLGIQLLRGVKGHRPVPIEDAGLETGGGPIVVGGAVADDQRPVAVGVIVPGGGEEGAVGLGHLFHGPGHGGVKILTGGSGLQKGDVLHVDIRHEVGDEGGEGGLVMDLGEKDGQIPAPIDAVGQHLRLAELVGKSTPAESLRRRLWGRSGGEHGGGRGRGGGGKHGSGGGGRDGHGHLHRRRRDGGRRRGGGGRLRSGDLGRGRRTTACNQKGCQQQRDKGYVMAMGHGSHGPFRMISTNKYDTTSFAHCHQKYRVAKSEFSRTLYHVTFFYELLTPEAPCRYGQRGAGLLY